MTRVYTLRFEVCIVDPVDVALVDAHEELVTGTPDGNAGSAPRHVTLLVGYLLETGSHFSRQDNSSTCDNSVLDTCV